MRAIYLMIIGAYCSSGVHAQATRDLRNPLNASVQHFAMAGTFSDALEQLAIQLRPTVVFGFLKARGPGPKVTISVEQATAGEVLARMCAQDGRYKIVGGHSPHVINIVPINDNGPGRILLRLRLKRFDLVTDDWPQNLFMRLPDFSPEIRAYLAHWYSEEAHLDVPVGSAGANIAGNVSPPHIALHFEEMTVMEILNAISDWVVNRAAVNDPSLPEGVKIWPLGWKCEVPPVDRSPLDAWAHSVFSPFPK